MRIDVTGRHFEITPAILERAEKKCEKLPKYYDGVQSIEVIVEQLPQDKFSVELRVDVEKHDTFVSSEQGDDLYLAIDSGVDKMVRQLTDFKDKLKNQKR
ncbi:MAG: ribosome hibernation promoting factor [Phycisphaerales bacterium]